MGVRGLFRACEGTVLSGPLLSARLCVPICWLQLFCCCWGWVDSSGVDVLVVVRGLVFGMSCGEVLISLRGSMIIVSTWLLKFMLVPGDLVAMALPKMPFIDLC